MRPANYCVQLIIVPSNLLCPSTLGLDIHLFNFPLWTCVHSVVSCCAHGSPSFQLSLVDMRAQCRIMPFIHKIAIYSCQAKYCVHTCFKYTFVQLSQLVDMLHRVVSCCAQSSPSFIKYGQVT